MKTLIPSSKKHVLKILSSLLLLLLMIPGAFAQEAVSDENLELFNKGDMNKLNVDPDKAATYRLNVVGSDALIYGLIVGRGGGSISTNSAFGLGALFSNTTGLENNAIGSWALHYNETGFMNNAIGGSTLSYNTAGYYNTAVGGYTLHNNKTGFMNTAIGPGALYYNETGSSNNAFGHLALHNNTSGFRNIAIGVSALHHNKDRSNLVAVGDSALFNNGLNATQAYHAAGNTALGSKALYENTTGYYNTAVGFEALTKNISGEQNTAMGYQALLSNTTGRFNSAFGWYSLYSNTSGYHNTAVGLSALRYNNTEYGNTAVGYAAGWLYNTTQGTFLGANAYASARGYTNVTGIGYAARPNGSNVIHVGNTAVGSIKGQVGFTTFSDGNYKTNIREDVAGLDFILSLRPVSYNVDIHKLAADVGEDETIDDEGDKKMVVPDEITLKSRDEKSAIREVGFVAQEVEVLVNELGVAFNGVDAPQNDTGQYGLRYASFVVPLVRAVQEQQAQIEALSPEGIEALQGELAVLRVENQLMRGQINDIISLLENLGVDVRQSTGYGINEGQQQYPSGNARLEQNTPNPFHENTVIRYFLPEGTHRAQILITDMGGTQVMSLPLEHQGAGQVLIHGGTLPSGTYVYTLTVDGRKVDSKRMVLL